MHDFLNFAKLCYCKKPILECYFFAKAGYCMEKLFLGLDVLAIFPTSYGKCLIFHLLPMHQM